MAKSIFPSGQPRVFDDTLQTMTTPRVGILVGSHWCALGARGACVCLLVVAQDKSAAIVVLLAIGIQMSSPMPK